MKFRYLLAVLLAIPGLCFAPAFAADNAGRFALVIGNSKYPDAEAPLKEPINDARDVAAELKRSGFEVDVGENLGGDAMRRALEKLYGKLKPGSVALVFFSGYGVQSARQSYLLPVDAQIWTEPDVRRDGFSLETILNEISGRGAGIKIALLDASRRNPYERRFRSFSAGLAPVIAPGGTLVMYSAGLSSVVSETGSAHSLFVSELLKEIKSPDLTAEEALNRTRVAVTKALREQVPWISSSLAEDFAFVPGARPAPAPASKPAAAPAPAPAPAVAVATPAPAPVAAAPVPPKPAAQPDLPATEPPRDEGRIALALAMDPTVKQLNAKLAENPEDVSALYRRGQVYASKGAYALAAKDFDDTIRLSPKDVEALNNRCWVRAVINDLAAALKDCNEALRLRPNFVDALDSRGLVNLKNGQSKNAIVDFDDALRINPRLTSSLYGRGLAKQRTGATAEGELDVNNAKAMDPDIVKEFAGYGVQ